MKIWKKVFDLQGDDVIEVYHRLALLRDLTDDLERSIKQVPDIRHEQSFKVLPELRGIISRPNLGEGFDSHRAVLKMIMNALEFASERLQHVAPEPVLPKAELDSLRTQAELLLASLGESKGLPKSLRLILYLISSRQFSEASMSMFCGIRGVREQLFVVASKIQEHMPEFEESQTNPEVVGFWRLFKNVDSVTAAILHVKELIGIAAPLLPALVEHLPK